jgi:hypothetical protein
LPRSLLGSLSPVAERPSPARRTASTAAALLLLAVLTAFTGARTRIVWFKISPVLLGCSAALLLVASLT